MTLDPYGYLSNREWFALHELSIPEDLRARVELLIGSPSPNTVEELEAEISDVQATVDEQEDIIVDLQNRIDDLQAKLEHTENALYHLEDNIKDAIND